MSELMRRRKPGLPLPAIAREKKDPPAGVGLGGCTIGSVGRISVRNSAKGGSHTPCPGSTLAMVRYHPGTTLVP
jgi:hypothetical protein